MYIIYVIYSQLEVYVIILKYFILATTNNYNNEKATLFHFFETVFKMISICMEWHAKGTCLKYRTYAIAEVMYGRETVTSTVVALPRMTTLMQ